MCHLRRCISDDVERAPKTLVNVGTKSFKIGFHDLATQPLACRNEYVVDSVQFSKNLLYSRFASNVCDNCSSIANLRYRMPKFFTSAACNIHVCTQFLFQFGSGKAHSRTATYDDYIRSMMIHNRDL